MKNIHEKSDPPIAWHNVIVSGYCISEDRFFYNLKGKIGDTSYGWKFKVWPDDDKIGNGKLWFHTFFTKVVDLGEE